MVPLSNTRLSLRSAQVLRRERVHAIYKRLSAVYLLLGKRIVQQARLSPGGEGSVESTASTPCDGSACGSFANEYGAGHERSNFCVRSRLREAECVHCWKCFRIDFTLY